MKTFTYKVNILDIVRYDMPKTFDPISLNELDFVKLLKCEAYDNEISENIHRTHITLDEFGEVPMYQFFLDDNEIDDISNEYVIDDEEPFVPNDDRYFIFTFIWKLSKVAFDVPNDFDSSKIKWIVENYYSHDWGDEVIVFKPCEIECNGTTITGKIENNTYEDFYTISLFKGRKEIRRFHVNSESYINEDEIGA